MLKTYPRFATILLTIICLLPVQLVIAAPVGAVPQTSAITQGALRLAMLEAQPKNLSNKRSKRIKRFISKRRPIIASLAPKKPKLSSRNLSPSVSSASCLRWSAAKINNKAKKFDKSINQYSRQYGIDSNLVKSIITAESCFKVKAKSHANAHGLMQLIPATAARFGVTDSYNSDQNIRGGVKYLKFLKGYFKGDLTKMIAAYNAGEGAVTRYKGVPPYKETKNYVRNVLSTYEKLKPKKVRITKIRKVIKEKVTKKKAVKRVKVVYHPPKLGNKAGRQGWRYNRRLAPQLYKH